MTEEVVKLAAALGRQEETGELALLCSAAVEELTVMLREGVAPEECGQAFPLAAAWLALGRAGTGEAGVESFTAGEVSIRKGDGEARQKALRMQALQVMKPYQRDEGFLFRGVRG